MTLPDWVDYLVLSPALFPYWKAALKYLCSHVWGLFLGLFGLIVSKSLTGGQAMRKPEWLDYAVAHPLTVPFWVWAFLYMFITLSPVGWLGLAFPLLFFVLWLRLWLQSLALILECHGAEPGSDERKELLPCTQPSNI